jgi:hypothetical protein
LLRKYAVEEICGLAVEQDGVEFREETIESRESKRGQGTKERGFA